MAKITIYSAAGAKTGEVDLDPAKLDKTVRRGLLKEALIAFLASQRQGSHKTKDRGEVAGGGKKPWRQKGTGRARAGSFQSPLWVGGGVVFGPKPRDFGKKVSKKTRTLALRKALSERLKAGDVVVVDDLKLSSPKTKAFNSIIEALDCSGSTLVISTGIDKNLTLAARNVVNVALATSDSLNTYDVLRPDKLVFTKSAFEKIEARLTQE